MMRRAFETVALDRLDRIGEKIHLISKWLCGIISKLASVMNMEQRLVTAEGAHSAPQCACCGSVYPQTSQEARITAVKQRGNCSH